jgi:hypothetical protein
VQSFVAEISGQFKEDDTVLIVSSNGRLRYFLNLVQDEFEKRKENGQFKLKTGNIGKIVYQGGDFKLAYWNEVPKSGFRI